MSLIYPTNELVAASWCKQRVEDRLFEVGTSLPKDLAPWLEHGFLQVQALVGGTPDIDLPVRRPIVQLDAYFAPAAASRQVPWGKANQIIEVVRDATESPSALYGRPVELPSQYHPVRVQSVYFVTEPRRILDDPAGFARFTVDVAFDWAVVKAAA